MGVVKPVHDGDDMPDLTSLVDTYLAPWNEPDPERRRALVEQTWTEDGEYLDPLMGGEGADEIDAMIAAAQTQFPGTHFELHTDPTPTTTASASPGRCARGRRGRAATGHDYGTDRG